jgi:hypothetical protein
LQRDRIIAMNHIPCGKETKRQLGEEMLKSGSSSQNTEIDFGCRVYSNGKVAGVVAQPEMEKRRSPLV